MDKETLSNYGWIVIAVLVLVVMIALATPFGSFIKSGVENTAQGLFDTEQKALSVVGMDIADQSFESGSDTTAPDPALNPDDGTTPQDGDTYTYGDYEYTYKTSYNGWNVKVLDKAKTEYGAILSSINGADVTNMNSTFYECTSLETAPTIPSSVTDMSFSFYGTSIAKLPNIPSGVTSLQQAFMFCEKLTDVSNLVITNNINNTHWMFYGCTSLEDASTITFTEGVTRMVAIFTNCSALKKAPIVPSSVVEIHSLYEGCTSLSGSIEVNMQKIQKSEGNPYQGYFNCLYRTNVTSIEGTSPNDIKELLLLTKSTHVFSE